MRRKGAGGKDKKMIRGISAAIALALFAAPAFAAENTCKAPMAPTVPNGKTAEAHDLVVAANDVKTFIKASDDYQLCLNTWMDAEAKTAADAKQPLDAKIKAQHDQLGDANQKEKERIGVAYNTAVADYRKAHPK